MSFKLNMRCGMTEKNSGDEKIQRDKRQETKKKKSVRKWERKGGAASDRGKRERQRLVMPVSI